MMYHASITGGVACTVSVDNVILDQEGTFLHVTKSAFMAASGRVSALMILSEKLKIIISILLQHSIVAFLVHQAAFLPPDTLLPVYIFLLQIWLPNYSYVRYHSINKVLPKVKCFLSAITALFL